MSGRAWRCGCDDRMEQDGLFCGRCGTARSRHDCVNCGTIFKADDRFCRNCGKARVQKQTHVVDVQEPNKKPKTTDAQHHDDNEQVVPKPHKARMMVPQNGRQGLQFLEPTPNLLDVAVVRLTPEAHQLRAFLASDAT